MVELSTKYGVLTPKEIQDIAIVNNNFFNTLSSLQNEFGDVDFNMLNNALKGLQGFENGLNLSLQFQGLSFKDFLNPNVLDNINKNITVKADMTELEGVFGKIWDTTLDVGGKVISNPAVTTTLLGLGLGLLGINNSDIMGTSASSASKSATNTAVTQSYPSNVIQVADAEGTAVVVDKNTTYVSQVKNNPNLSNAEKQELLSAYDRGLDNLVATGKATKKKPFLTFGYIVQLYSDELTPIWIKGGVTFMEVGIGVVVAGGVYGGYRYYNKKNKKRSKRKSL